MDSERLFLVFYVIIIILMTITSIVVCYDNKKADEQFEEKQVQKNFASNSGKDKLEVKNPQESALPLSSEKQNDNDQSPVKRNVQQEIEDDNTLRIETDDEAYKMASINAPSKKIPKPTQK